MIHATSETHPIHVDVVPIEGLPGRLGLTIAPGKKGRSQLSRVRWERDLVTDLRALKERCATDVLVSLLRPYEYELLEIPRLAAEAERLGLATRRFEIDDMSVPAVPRSDAFRDFVAELHADLARGRNVTVHCRGGLGRSGLVAACLLVYDGEAPAAAIARVRACRRGAIETRGQERYVHDFAEGTLDGDEARTPRSRHARPS
jgi:protein-tyrosine phosphatase